MSKFGGGGTKCTICDKTAYPAETIQFEKLPYHVECFRCTDCNKKMEGAAKAKQFESKLYCEHCFQKGGFAQKQKKVVWTKKESTGSATSSKFGGGGNPCTVCAKTVYLAETLSFEKKIYHAGCFKCAECSKKMSASDAAAFEDNVYCKKCFTAGGYNRKQAATAKKSGGGGGSSNAMASKFGGGGVKCKICEKTVYSAEQVSYEKQAYHADCFKCSREVDGKPCGKKLTPSGAAQFDGKLFCIKCFGEGGYRQKQAATAKSGAGTGTSNALASKFGGGGTKCSVCDKTVYSAELVSFEKSAFHADCFKCKNCSKKLSTASAEGKKLPDGGVDAYCKKCWGELGLNRATVN